MIESILFEQPQARGARIKVVGVGGCGGNAVNNLADSNLAHIEFLAANTDIQALGVSLADHKLQIGGVLTSGLGAGGDPEIGHLGRCRHGVYLRRHGRRHGHGRGSSGGPGGPRCRRADGRSGDPALYL
jgi:cell division GTPase FtsZ